MSSVTRPRGPRPARVYWTRRIIVLAVAFALVFGLAHLLGGSSDGRSGSGETAARVAADTVTPIATGSRSPTARPTRKKSRTASPKPPPKPPPLAQPDGPCSDDEVLVKPVLAAPQGGGQVTITLEVTSSDSAACTVRVSAETVVVKLISGKDFIWSSQECPTSMPDVEVVARTTVPGRAQVLWSGRRSDADCKGTTAWADTGWYHAIAAALGGEPTDVQFELLEQAADTVTVTASPTQKPSVKPTKQPTKQPSGNGPSGAVEPDPQT